MKKKNVYTLNMGYQESEDMEGKENKDNTTTSGLLYSEADRCPICLNCLLEKEVGFPESCNHAFCMTCILKWAETLASCPIDRKPFQAVFKFSALEGCVKVQVKNQLIETTSKENENDFKKQLSCHENSKWCTRKKVLQDLCTNFYDLKLINRNFKYCEIGGKKAAAVKTYKPQRSSQCTSHYFRNFFSNVYSPSSHTGESSFTCRTYCTDYIEVDEISALTRQKRQELELSWFPDTLPGIGRTDFVAWNIETAVLPLISSVLPRTIFPASTRSLESLGISYKGYALAHTQGGEEKKQTSGTSNTRGSRRKPAATTPTRRSTRHTRAETVNQSQRSPVSSTSGCDTPDNNNPPVSVSSSAESEKQTRQAPKRKSIRRGRKAPLLKKKLRSSMPSPEKPSSDSIDEETAESDTPPVLEKEHQADLKRGNLSPVPVNIENESADGLGSCSEKVEENEENIEDCVEQKRVGSPYSESCTQDTPLVVGEKKETHDIEEVVTEAATLCVDSDNFKSISKNESDSFENKDKNPEPFEAEVKRDRSTDDPPNDSLIYSGSDTDLHQSVPSLSELSEYSESVISEEKAELTDQKDSAVKSEHLVDIPELESLESEITQPMEKISVENSEDQLEGHTENEDMESVSMCDASGNEISDSTQDPENNLLKNNDKLESPLEEKTESLVEHPTSAELTNTHIEQIQKPFSEDNNETIPMECDSFCSDQNESEIEPSANADTTQLIVHSVEFGSQNNPPCSDSTNEKAEIKAQPSESSLNTVDKAKKPRTRRSRFHSSSTTWSPNKDPEEEKKHSQSPSPKRETGRESRKSPSPSSMKEPVKGEIQSHSHSPKREVASEKRRSRSQSPQRESIEESKGSESLSPNTDTIKENKRCQLKRKDSSPREGSRSQSKERESDRDGQRRDLGREKRTGMWSRSRSRSRSPSRSRTKSKSSSFGRNDRDSYSRMKERWPDDGWRCSRDGDWYRKDDSDRQNENARKEKYNMSSDVDDPNFVDRHRNECPSWVTEKLSFGPDPRTRNPEKFKNSHWEDNRNENAGYYWNKNFGSGWMPHRGRGHRSRGHRGRGNYWGGFASTEQNESCWQDRKPLSGNSNSSGNETFKSVEQQPNKQKSEQQFSFDTPADRSGWTSASSWAVRKTLPADVQNYYSRRGRNSSGSQSGWTRQEEETAEQDSNQKDQTNQQGDGSQLPVNMMPPPMNVMQPQMNVQHQPMNIFPYPMGVPAPMMNMPRHPFNMHPQLPLHLHTGLPLMQVAAPASVSQGLLPPPPPPPPPSQQASYMASQPDGKQLQGVPGTSHVSNNMSTPDLPAPVAAPGNTGTVQGPSSGNTSSSSHSKASNAAVKLAESKKLQIQEKAAQEVKLAIKPFYQNKDITKDEYKEIVRKAVDKVCHSKSGEVNSTKVANLVKAYVDKYKYSRKGSQKKTLEEPLSTEKNIG
ncbi:protein SCAF11 isoform X2 [Erinaceus europaeus]|uniref:Protein SCAF11 isoform X2 n=1 Tax=Erinaceus europaeus TaxID=9365 RepID=A0A1S3WDG2_ERIEU|nr:protein SCAF11 isoform X2 [Erinaceus europaeus]